MNEMGESVFLDHVAIAVENLNEAKKFYQQLGLVFSTEEEVVEEQKVRTAFAAIDQHAHLELLLPTDESSSVADFIAKRGPGLHHLCFRVKDVEEMAKKLRQQGYRLLYDRARVGAKGCLVNFIHPKSSAGVLIEISQSTEDAL